MTDTPTPAPSNREKIEALQQEMLPDQATVAKEAVELYASPECVKLMESVNALRARAIPGSGLDQQLTQMLTFVAQQSQFFAQTYQQLQQQAAQQQR